MPNQRLHGPTANNAAPLDLNKCADSPVLRFFNLVTKVMQRDGCERTTAMRKIRRSHPKLMKRLNMMEVYESFVERRSGRHA